MTILTWKFLVRTCSYGLIICIPLCNKLVSFLNLDQKGERKRSVHAGRALLSKNLFYPMSHEIVGRPRSFNYNAETKQSNSREDKPKYRKLLP